MERRQLIQIGAIGGLAAIIPASCAKHPSSAAKQPSYAGGVFYTKDAPGRWDKKVGGHLPQIEKKSTDDGKIEINVVTTHGMTGYEHYIVKHILLDKDFKFLDEKMFDPTKDAPKSKFYLENYSGTLYALSVCNKHDTWLNMIEV